MATIRKKHRAPVSVFQRDPGPWSRLLIDWLATLAVIMIFGLVMLFSASYTTGYLRMGDSFHYIKQQALCMMLGLGCMFLMSYMDHRFLRKMVVPGYIIVLAMLAVTLWAYRPVSLAEAADARTGLEPKVVVVVRLDEMDGNGTSHEYQAYDPALLEQMELLVDTARLRLVRRSSIAPLDGMCKIVIIGEDNIICSFDYNLDTNAIYIGDRIYALRSTQSEPLSELTAAICGEV